MLLLADGTTLNKIGAVSEWCKGGGVLFCSALLFPSVIIGTHLLERFFLLLLLVFKRNLLEIKSSFKPLCVRYSFPPPPRFLFFSLSLTAII